MSNTDNNKIGFLFDLDGVIIDSERKYTEIWGRIESRFPTGVPNFCYAIKGTTLENILDTYFSDPQVRPKVVEMLYDEEGKMKYEYCPGARGFLLELKRRGLPMALYTSSNEEKMSHLYEEIPELRTMFDAYVLGDMVSKSKPDPEGYLRAAEMLGVISERCAVFEDSLQGVKAGKASNGLVVGDVGTLKAEDLRPYSDILIDNLSDLNIDKLIEDLKSR